MAGDREQGARVRERHREPSPLNTPDANFLWSRVLLDALVGQGVQDAVVSSGARCAPLVLAAARTPGLSLHTHPDERAAGFRALGIAKFTRRPVVLICTSGTAGANYHPAVIEARMAHVPLVVLTADRPPEMRGTGAPQTIDQVALFGRHVLAFRDLEPPASQGTSENWARTASELAVVSVTGPVGPVHLNVPFREPLLPAQARIDELSQQFIGSDFSKARAAVAQAPPIKWERVVGTVRGRERGIIICGPDDNEDDFLASLLKLTERTGFPVLADPISRVRFSAPEGVPVVSYYDLLLLNSSAAERLRPDVVIRFGGLPTSKRLNEWLAARERAEQIVIDSHSEIADPYRMAGQRIVSRPAQACDALCDCLGGGGSVSQYAEEWQRADRLIGQILATELKDRDGVFEGAIAASAMRLAPPGVVVFLSSSLPIRLVDSFAAAGRGPLRVMANRGANGIDGVVSTAAGIAAVSSAPVLLLIGDVAFLHDLNGLLGVADNRLNLKIVLLNNNGGGIFSFLPLAEHTETFERLVAMPHGRNFATVADFFSIPHQVAASGEDFERLFREIMKQAGPAILEVTTSRALTFAGTRDIHRRVIEAGLVE